MLEIGVLEYLCLLIIAHGGLRAAIVVVLKNFTDLGHRLLDLVDLVSDFLLLA